MRFRSRPSVLAGPRPFVQAGFRAPDGTLPAAYLPERGPLPTVHSGTWDITNGRLRKTAEAAGHDNLTWESGRPDVFVETVWYPAASATCGIIGRLTDTSNYWLVQFSNTGGDAPWSIFERNAGTFTERAAGAFTFAAGARYILRAWFTGSQIVATIDGGSQISYASASLNLTATRFGLNSYRTAGEFGLVRIRRC